MTQRLRFLPHMRVRRGADFQSAYRRGSRARGSLLLVVAARNGLDHSRLGLSVGRKIWKSAVRRNRVRRVFREAFRLSYPELPAGHDFILIPAAPALDPALEPTRAELVHLARKAARRHAERRRAEGAEGAPERRSEGAGDGA